MIHFQNVTKKYNKEITALEDISFEITPGEFVFLIGPSGSGKTTIIKMLIREEDPSHGKIYFDNDDITRYSRRQIYSLRRKIGVIFQDFKLIEDKTAFENISFVMEAAGHGNKSIRQTVPYLLDIVGLGDRQTAFPRELSGGEKQRVAIARALANNPKLLIADEPTGNLDPDSSWDIVQILKKINEWGTTVFMSTHGMDIVKELGQRVLKVENGFLVSDEAIENKKSEKEIHKENFEENVTKNSEIILPETAKILIPDDIVLETPESIIKEGENDDSKNDAADETESKENSDSDEQPKEVSKEVEDLKEKETEKDKIEVNKTENEEETKESVKDEKKETEEKKTESESDKPKPRLKISLVSKKDKKHKDKKTSAKHANISNDSSLSKLNISKQILSLLTLNGFNEVEDIIKAGIDEIEKIEGIDDKKANELKSALAKYIQENL